MADIIEEKEPTAKVSTAKIQKIWFLLSSRELVESRVGAGGGGG